MLYFRPFRVTLRYAVKQYMCTLVEVLVGIKTMQLCNNFRGLVFVLAKCQMQPAAALHCRHSLAPISNRIYIAILHCRSGLFFWTNCFFVTPQAQNLQKFNSHKILTEANYLKYFWHSMQGTCIFWYWLIETNT